MAEKIHFTKEEFLKFIAEYKLPEDIQEIFWRERPYKSDFIDPDYIIVTAKNLQAEYVDVSEIAFIENALKFNGIYDANTASLN